MLCDMGSGLRAFGQRLAESGALAKDCRIGLRVFGTQSNYRNGMLVNSAGAEGVVPEEDTLAAVVDEDRWS